MRALRPAVLVAVAAAALPLARGAALDPQLQRALKALRGDGSAKVRAQAALTLGRHGARDAAPALRRALLEDDAPAVRVAAAAALARTGGPEDVAALRDASTGDASGAVRAAASRTLDQLLLGARTVVVEAVDGKGIDAASRARFQDALARQLPRHGFAVVDAGASPRYRLRPAVLRLDQERGPAASSFEVKASVVATDPKTGRVAAIVEGGARAASPGPAAPPSNLLAGEACEAAARSISEDLARRLLERP